MSLAATGIRTLLRTRTTASAQLARSLHASIRRNEHFLDASPETFARAVANKDKVVLVDFYANWCGPCKMISPILEKLTADADVKTGSGKSLDLVTVDTDAQPELAQQFQVSSLPTVIAFDGGKPVSQFIGAMPEGSVRNFLKTL